MSADEPGLLCLPHDVLLGVLSKAGAKAVARAATCCKRLLDAQQALSKLPAFSSAMVLINDLDHVEEDTAEAVDTALAAMPAAVDFALCFVANLPSQGSRSSDPLDVMLTTLSTRLPPGTKVSGCTGRGIFGVLPCGTPAEIDPSSTKSAGISLLLGRVPGATAHVFAASRPPAGGWGSEAACRAWMGLAGGASSLAPLSLMLFTKSGFSHLIEGCLEGLHEALPDMVVTGGIAASGQRRKEVICFEADGGRGGPAAVATLPTPPPAPAAPRATGPGRITTRSAAAAVASSQFSEPQHGGGPSSSHEQAARPTVVNAGANQQYVGLVLCAPLEGSGSGSGAAEAPSGTRGGTSSPPDHLQAAPSDVTAADSVAVGAARAQQAQQAQRLCAGAFSSRGLLGVKPIFYEVSLARGLGHFVNSEGQQVEMFAVSTAESEGVIRGGTRPQGAALVELTMIVAEVGHADLALWAAERTNIGSYEACIESGQPLVVVKTMSHGAAVMGAVDPSLLPACDDIIASAERPSHTLAAQLLVTAPEGYARDIQRCVPEFKAACPPGGQGHLAAAHSSGMVVVSCTAKGAAMHKAEGVEARLLHQAGKIPLAGVYCDGEIGPAAHSSEQCGRRWNGGGPLAAQCNKLRSALQGFTTIVSVIAGGGS